MPAEITGSAPDQAPQAATAQMALKGEFLIKMSVVILLALILLGLIAIGIALLFKKPEEFAGYIHVIIPILSGTIFGLLGFVVGQKVKEH
jgi:ABC-type Na+ efflux pump permease subunit